MKKISYIILLALTAGMFSCKKADFAEAYPDPSKISETTVGKQFSGMLYAANDYYSMRYRHYFVTLRITLNHYNQAAGWANESGQYIPGSAAISEPWDNYYKTLSQFRGFETVYGNLSDIEKEERKIYLLAAKIFMYDYTQRMVDLYGAIPFFEAGKISQYAGDYNASYAKFDSPESIYTAMLDDLKSIAGEIGGITLNEGLAAEFKSQDYLNAGDIGSWQKYCNSLRLRMLNRVSAASEFSARSASEMAEIIGNPGTFPVVESNDENIFIDVYDINSEIESEDLDQTFGEAATWYLQTAGKRMMDFMSENNDPRLKTLFEPGENAKGKYYGIDQLAPSSDAVAMINDTLVAIYNRSTFEHNKYFPGVLLNAAEVDLIKAEYHLRNNNEAMAKTAYEKAIGESIDMYYTIQSLSENKEYATAGPPTSADKAAYIAMDGVAWDSNSDKLKLIAMQKWVHYNLVQPYENWADNRRLDKLGLEFEVDNASQQTLPPVRWNIPSSEITYNLDNYQMIKGEDDLNNKLFWDVN